MSATVAIDEVLDHLRHRRLQHRRHHAPNVLATANAQRGEPPKPSDRAAGIAPWNQSSRLQKSRIGESGSVEE